MENLVCLDLVVSGEKMDSLDHQDLMDNLDHLDREERLDLLDLLDLLVSMHALIPHYGMRSQFHNVFFSKEIFKDSSDPPPSLFYPK